VLRKLFYFVCVVSIAACETPTAQITPRGIERFADDPQLGEKVERVCFGEQVDAFRRPDRESVILRKGRTEYILEVRRSCSELESAGMIGLERNEFCLGTGETLLVSQTSNFGDARLGPQRCEIIDVRRWHHKRKEAPKPAEENPA